MARPKFKPSPKQLKQVKHFSGLGLLKKDVAACMGYSPDYFTNVIMKNSDVKDAFLTGRGSNLALLIDKRNSVAMDDEHKHWERANASMIDRLERELSVADDGSSIADAEAIKASITLELKGQ